MSRGGNRRDARRRRTSAAAGGPGSAAAAPTDARATDPSGPVPAGPLPTPPEPTSSEAAAPAGPARRRALVAGVGAVALLFVIAAILRLWDLPLAPFHNDEGVNGWFTAQLLRTGAWSYDPANYHGPTFFYAAAVSGLLVGLGDVSMRLVPAAFGLATLGLVLLAGRWIGRVGALVAATLLAVSPGMVFFSRYAIHEMLLVCFTLAFVLAATRWWETGRTRFLLAASAALAGMFTTKETAIITVAVLGLAAGCVPLYERLSPRILGRPAAWAVRPSARPLPRRPGRAALEHLGGAARVRRDLAAAGAVFVVIWVTLFSSLFTNLPGIGDSLRSLTIWTTTSGVAMVAGPLQYVEWMAAAEVALVLLGGVGLALAAWTGRSRFAIFAGAWGVGLLLAYSLVGYKTPWLMLNWLVPLGLVAGWAAGRLLASPRPPVRVGAGVVLGACLIVSTWQALTLAFVDYDREEHPYVHAQTSRQVLSLVAWLEREDARRATAGQLGIVVMSPDYWPLPWYLRDDTKAGYYSQVVDVAAPVQIVRADQVASLPPGFAERYREDARYELRPGVELVVYAARP